jgi:hypothetical protein
MLKLIDLSDRVRQLMLDELEMDIRNGTLYVSPRLSNTGQQNYATLLREAIRSHDDAWLADRLRRLGRVKPTESRRKPKGGFTTARVPFTAAATIAEGEFNRFYARGLARLAGEEGIPNLEVYRAKQVARPRPESEQLVNTLVNAQQLLLDLRSHPGMEPALHIPPGHNSGLSVRLPAPAPSNALRQ